MSGYVSHLKYRQDEIMGSGASRVAKVQVAVWSEQELEENEKAIKFQRQCADKIAEHYYYGLPVKAKKESNDPLSPLWIQIDEEAIENFNGNSSGDIGQVFCIYYTTK